MERQNNVLRCVALVLASAPGDTCDIALGDVGVWNSAGVIKLRNADGTDAVIGYEAATAIIPVAAVATGALAGSPVYANGVAGAGATLIRGTNGALAAQDGVTLTPGQLLIVAGESTESHNGLYVVTAVGSSSAKYVLTRSPLFDVSARMSTGALFVPQGGTVYAGVLMMYTGPSAPTVGTTSLTFAPAVAESLASAALANGVGGNALSAGAQRFLAFAGVAAAGPCTLTGAKVGDTVSGIIDLAAGSASAAGSFESTISVANQIQQTSSSDLHTKNFAALLVAKS
jgi:hypothetical protein